MFLLVEVARSIPMSTTGTLQTNGRRHLTSTRRGSWKTLPLLSDALGSVRYWHLADIA